MKRVLQVLEVRWPPWLRRKRHLQNRQQAASNPKPCRGSPGSRRHSAEEKQPQQSAAKDSSQFPPDVENRPDSRHRECRNGSSDAPTKRRQTQHPHRLALSREWTQI